MKGAASAVQANQAERCARRWVIRFLIVNSPLFQFICVNPTQHCEGAKFRHESPWVGASGSDQRRVAAPLVMRKLASGFLIDQVTVAASSSNYSLLSGPLTQLPAQCNGLDAFAAGMSLNAGN